MSKRLMIYDASEKSFVGFSWKVGAAVFKSYFDTILAVQDWTDCHKQLAALVDKYDEVQFWGHGSPGFIYVNSQPAPAEFWFALAKKISKNATVWLRVCSFAASSIGKTMMNQISKNLGAKIIAHTYSIGQWGCQSGTRAVTPTTLAGWSATEGVDKSKTPAELLPSSPWAPNTVFSLTMRPPDWVTNK